MDYSKIEDIEFDGIDYSDYPDFCDAFICSAYWDNGQELTEDELDQINDDSQYVYEKLMEYLY